MAVASPAPVPVERGAPVGQLPGDGLDAVLFVLRSRMARRVLVLLSRRRMATKPLLRIAFGTPSNTGHEMLRRLETLGLIRRYPGRNDANIPVVWNELTPLGRRVLEIVEEMES